MKTSNIVIRVSAEDMQTVRKAVRKYHKETGKENVSDMIRYLVRAYNTQETKVP